MQKRKQTPALCDLFSLYTVQQIPHRFFHAFDEAMRMSERGGEVEMVGACVYVNRHFVRYLSLNKHLLDGDMYEICNSHIDKYNRWSWAEHPKPGALGGINRRDVFYNEIKTILILVSGWLQVSCINHNFIGSHRCGIHIEQRLIGNSCAPSTANVNRAFFILFRKTVFSLITLLSLHVLLCGDFQYFSFERY